MNKEVLMKKAKKTANWLALISLVFNVSMFSVFVPEVAKADAPTPATQTLIYPANGEHVAYENLVFNWTEAVDVSGHNPVEYKFQVSTSSAVNTAPASYFTGTIVYEKDWNEIESLDTNYLDASIESMPLVEGQTYYWHVRAEDSNGGVKENRNAWSEVRSFTVVLPAPDLVSPTDNSYNNGAVLTMDWSDVTGAARYKYQSCRDLACTNEKWSGYYNISTKSATKVPNDTFFWRVLAVNASGLEGIWSETWKVNVDSTAPTFSSVTIASDNTNPSLAKVGDTVTVSLTSSEDLLDVPDATIDGQIAVVSGSGKNFTATYTLTDTDTEGIVPFTVYNYFDLAANPGSTVTTTTNLSQVWFDKTAPRGVSEAVIYATNPTNDNDPTVEGKFFTDLNEEFATANINPSDYDIVRIDVVFENGIDRYTKQTTMNYLTGQFTTEGINGYNFSTLAVEPTFLPDGTYKVTAVAYDWAGNQAVPFPIEDAQVIDTTKPAEVTNLVVTGKTDTTVSLKWDAVAEAAGYKVYTLNSEGVEIGTPRDAGNVTSYSVTGLNANTAYSFKVLAYDVAMNDSLASNVVSDTTNPTPVVLSASVTTNPIAKATVGATAPEGAIAGATDENIDENTGNKDEKKDENKNSGFSWLWLLLLALLAGGGYYYYTKNPAILGIFKKKKGDNFTPPAN